MNQLRFFKGSHTNFNGGFWYIRSFHPERQFPGSYLDLNPLLPHSGLLEQDKGLRQIQTQSLVWHDSEAMTGERSAFYCSNEGELLSLALKWKSKRGMAGNSQEVWSGLGHLWKASFYEPPFSYTLGLFNPEGVKGMRIHLKPAWPSLMRPDLCSYVDPQFIKQGPNYLQASGQSVLLRAEEFPFKISFQVIKTDSIEICLIKTVLGATIKF